jgi:hypothetical protein
MSTWTDRIVDLLGAFVLLWVLGLIFYRLNIHGARNRTRHEFAVLVGWAFRKPDVNYSLARNQLLRRAAIAALIGVVIASMFFIYIAHTSHK